MIPTMRLDLRERKPNNTASKLYVNGIVFLQLSEDEQCIIKRHLQASSWENSRSALNKKVKFPRVGEGLNAGNICLFLKKQTLALGRRLTTSSWVLALVLKQTSKTFVEPWNKHKLKHGSVISTSHPLGVYPALLMQAGILDLVSQPDFILSSFSS